MENRNIYIDFNGRCGDQFFQYAFARKIQIKIDNHEMIFMNFYNQYRWKNILNNDSFRNDLKYFNIVPNEAYVDQKTNLERFGSNKQKRIIKHYDFFKRLSIKLKNRFFAVQYQKKMQKNGIYYDDEFFDLFSYPKKDVNIFVRGYFENYKYYKDQLLFSALLKELSPICDISDSYSLDLLCRAKSTNSVCVSLRSWGEVPNDSNIYKSRMICDQRYFKLAIENVYKKHPNAVLFIFSDDIKWAKTVVDNRYPAFFESGKNSIGEKILLMSNCKHFIISNSSFSWWAQYLSQNQEKKVISPSKWYNDKDDCRIIDPDWTIIEV